MRARLTGRHSPEPWWVWEAAAFLEPRLRPSDRVLEVGGGNSTLWMGQRCAFVASIEESSEWREHIRREAERRGLNNVVLHPGPSRAAFQTLLQAHRWDIVIIDGPPDRFALFRDLMNGARASGPRVIVYDDTDRAENRPAIRAAKGFEANSFRGFKPQTLHACETTVFVQRTIP
jgi:precorrin-6B methylase 2